MAILRSFTQTSLEIQKLYNILKIHGFSYNKIQWGPTTLESKRKKEIFFCGNIHFWVKYPFKQHVLVHCRIGPNTLTKSKPS